MDMGILIPTAADSWEVAVRAEELGYTHAWFFDTALLNAEMFAAMGAAAVKTSKIKLCTGVMVPSNRIAPVAASGLATLNALAPGRIVFGVSTGFTGRRTMGLKPVTLADMCKFIEDVQGLLAGEMIELEIEGAVHKTRFLNPASGLININDPIPLAISALGPKTRGLVAKYGAQWLGASVHNPAEMEEMRALWTQAGRDLKDLYMVGGGGGIVLEEGETVDSPRIMAQAGPGAALLFHDAVEHEAFGSLIAGQFPFPDALEAYRKVYEKYEPADARYLSNHRGHLMFVRPEETHVTSDMINALGIVATREEHIQRLRGIKAIGINQVNCGAIPGYEYEMMESFASIMAEV